MTELGNRLKEARLAKELSLDDLQSMTKIQKRYLLGIEEGNYSSMPGNFYVRAFIKQYAEALDLNPDEIFETYKSEIPASYTEELPQQLSRVRTHKAIPRGNSKVFDVLPKVLIGVFVIGVASLLYYFVSSYANKGPDEAVTEKNEQVKLVKSQDYEKARTEEKTKNSTDKNSSGTKDANAEKPDENNKVEIEQASELEAPKQELTVVQSSGKNSTYSLNNTDQFVVKLVSKGQSWVSIKNGLGKSFFQGMLTAGSTDSQTVDLSAEKEAVIVVGRAVDTEIYVNDQKLEYVVAPNEVVRQNITIQYVPKTE
ncbi:helix-turn-helix domain-containing protein [Neobacillus dielmonensis]|uniref:helix-turn-helix domain-containing protein n=1 Tax=Neobacillus dielmonensis TaxID=1347369 RepID=UPI0005A7918E|nr:RodZ domain-containing protein [Neobacillus dielmonensis]